MASEQLRGFRRVSQGCWARMHASWFALRTQQVMCVDHSCELQSFPDVKRCAYLVVLRTVNGLHIAAYCRGLQKRPFPVSSP